jgi:hypothetical protein
MNLCKKIMKNIQFEQFLGIFPKHSRFHNDGQYLVGSENKFTESEKEVFNKKYYSLDQSV